MRTSFKHLALIGLALITLGADLPDSSVDLNYVVGAGDVLQIQVTGESQFTGKYTVRSDGTFFYAYLKAILVAGQSVADITRTLTERLSADYLVNPSLTISVIEYASKKVQVFGAVAKPGTYTLKGKTRLLELISQAGGLTTEAGGSVVVVRKISAATESSPGLSELTATDKVDGNATDETTGELNKGEATETGMDEHPIQQATGQEPEPETQRVAKGEINSVAAAATTETLFVNYSNIVEKGQLGENIEIKANDIINVPSSTEIYVMGQVNKPGPVKYESNITLLQAISIAGGPSPTASTKSTYIIRRTSNGKSEKVKIRLDRVIAQKAENPKLRANDVIVIPESFF